MRHLEAVTVSAINQMYEFITVCLVQAGEAQNINKDPNKQIIGIREIEP